MVSGLEEFKHIVKLKLASKFQNLGYFVYKFLPCLFIDLKKLGWGVENLSLDILSLI